MNLLRIFVFVFCLATYYILHTTYVYAQVPPPYVPCDEVRPDILHPFTSEFHSLRPYQASPCNQNKEDLAIFCGNDLIVGDSITKHRSEADSCQTLPGGKTEECTFTGSKTKEIAVKLSEAYLPIMGNTEMVTNYKGLADQLNDAQKVNEYVSWYLNGATNRAEYTFLDSEKKEDLDKIINFSGPLKKLLPEKIQREARVNTIKGAAATRHDQAVGCVYNLLGLFKVGQIVECYPKTIDKSYVRLSDWTKNNHLPPNEDDFENFSDYWIAYKEWRGKSCITILGFALCIDNPLKPNYWGNLFQNIPFSSTEDRKGEVEIQNSSFSINGPDIEVSNVKVTKSKPADLFFAHMQESTELASLLQKTYLAKGVPETGNTSSLTTPAGCNLTNIRTNPGDNLFAGEASATVKYDWKFSCVFDIPQTPKPCKVCSGKNCVHSNIPSCNPLDDECVSSLDCPVAPPPPPPDPSCTKTVSVNFSVISKTPLADEVWSRLVAGPSAIFKRIFPKLNVTGSPGSILDIPAATKVNYTGANPTSGELYFPHIGGISEYFLKGIQTMLRPKGYGETISFGETETTGTVPGIFASGSCPLVGENVYLLCSSFNGANSSGCHGSNQYWQSNGLCTPSWCQNYPSQTCCVNHYACRWQIPVLEGQQCYTNTYPDSVCYDPASTCKPEAYGLAADFAYSGNLCDADAPVVLPEINGQQLNWEVVTSFEFGCGGCAGGILKANDGTNAYEIHMYHLNEGIASGGVSGQQVGTLYCFPAAVGHPHVHIELRINGEMVKPDNLCQ